MRSLALFLLAIVQFLALPVTAQAQDAYSSRVISVESWVEEWDEATQQWVRVADEPVRVEQRAATRFERFAMPHPAQRPQMQQSAFVRALPTSQSIGEYGPFRVIDEHRAALVGSTNRGSIAAFEAMLAEHPGIETLELVEAPGTSDDVANLALARKIRAEGIATHVPTGGSVRSGAVELFLAGQTRTIDEGAEFAVHSWRDNYGREPGDYAADAPENRFYLDFYEEMGMSPERAKAFYDMTNSVPHVQALWLDAGDMRPWIAPEKSRRIESPVVMDAAPRLAYLDVTMVDLGALATLDADFPSETLAGMQLARLDLETAFP